MDYNPLALPSRLVLAFEAINVTTIILPESTALSLKVELRDGQYLTHTSLALSGANRLTAPNSIIPHTAAPTTLTPSAQKQNKGSILVKDRFPGMDYACWESPGHSSVEFLEEQG